MRLEPSSVSPKGVFLLLPDQARSVDREAQVSIHSLECSNLVEDQLPLLPTRLVGFPIPGVRHRNTAKFYRATSSKADSSGSSPPSSSSSTSTGSLVSISTTV